MYVREYIDGVVRVNNIHRSKAGMFNPLISSLVNTLNQWTILYRLVLKFGSDSLRFRIETSVIQNTESLFALTLLSHPGTTLLEIRNLRFAS